VSNRASPPIRQQTSSRKFLHYDRPICCLLKFIATPPARNPVIKQQNICCGRSKFLFRSKVDQIWCRNSKQQLHPTMHFGLQQCVWASSNAFGPPAMRSSPLQYQDRNASLVPRQAALHERSAPVCCSL
jgi:hypothetical protein